MDDNATDNHPHSDPEATRAEREGRAGRDGPPAGPAILIANMSQ